MTLADRKRCYAVEIAEPGAADRTCLVWAMSDGAARAEVKRSHPKALINSVHPYTTTEPAVTPRRLCNLEFTSRQKKLARYK